MKDVFFEARIAGVKLKNKIIRSATHEGLADADGNPTDALLGKYEALAKGGAGAIITVSMAKPSIIEPDIVKRLMEGKQPESRCIDCNYCQIGIEKSPLKCYYGKI